MKYALLLAAAIVLQMPSQAQQKELSLEESVLLNYSKYYPRALSDAQFLPSGNFIVFRNKDNKNNDVLTQLTCATGKEKTLLTLQDFNSNISSISGSFKNFPSLIWRNDEQFIFTAENFYALYDLKSNTAKKLFDIPEGSEEITFSPDTRHCAFVYEYNLQVVSEGQEPKILTYDGTESVSIGKAVHRNEFGINNGIFWSDDSKKIAYYRMDQSMVGKYPLVHINTKPAHLESIYYPMAGTNSHQVILCIKDISTDEDTKYIKPTGDPEKYLTSVKWTPDSKAIFVGWLNRDQNDLKMCKYDASTSKLIETLFEEKSNTYVEPEKPIWFNPKNNTDQIWFSERSGHQRLYLYNADNKDGLELTPGLFDVMDILGFENESNSLIYSGTGRVVKEGPKTDDSRNATQTYTYIYQQGKQDYGRILDDRIGTHDAKVSSNGKYIIEYYSSLETPLEISLFEVSGKKIKTLRTLENPMNELKIGKAELFQTKASNGDILYGRIVKPSDFDASKKYPILVYVYGGPHAQLVQNTYNAAAPLWMNWFAEQGYIVATIDNRGSANRGQAFEEQTFRQLGTVEMDDQNALIEYLRDQSWADTKHMAVHGWSFGGFMTMNLLLSFPGTFSCGVAGGPVCDWSMYEVMYTERYMDKPDNNADGYKGANLVERASALKDDLLIIHGTSDDVVLWQHSQAFIKSCIDSGVQVDYFVYPEHQHNVRGKDRAHLMVKVLTYIQEHIGDE